MNGIVLAGALGHATGFLVVGFVFRFIAKKCKADDPAAVTIIALAIWAALNYIGTAT